MVVSFHLSWRSAMATAPSSRLRRILSFLVTGVVVPALLNTFLIVRTGDGRQVAELASACVRSLCDSEERVTVQGVGASEEEAWRDAVHVALRTAVSPLVDAQTWDRDGRFICASVLGDGQGLITRCQDLGWKWDRGSVRREVAVFVNRAALVSKLRAAHLRVVAEVAQ
jgi:hypothetical protein